MEVLEDRWVADASTNLLLTLAANAKPDFQPNAYARGVQLTRGFDLLPGGIRSQGQGVTVNQAINSLKSNGLVVQARQNVKVQIDRIPNDPRFPAVCFAKHWPIGWGIAGQDIAAPLAGINRSEPAPSWWRSLIPASITTTTIWRQMSGSIREIPGNNRDDDGNGFVDDVLGYDFVNKRWQSMDVNGHGTHVAGKRLERCQ